EGRNYIRDGRPLCRKPLDGLRKFHGLMDTEALKTPLFELNYFFIPSYTHLILEGVSTWQL
ncbi:MAG: hypothetical protein QXN38_00520, partial [Desulfurococcaceae archaeon]